VYAQKPLSKRSSGRPDTGVGNIFLKCPKDQVRMCIEYQDSIQVSSSGLLFASMNFSDRRLVERRLTGKSG
jgi:hypothetical protein